jgi:CHAT domain-containing protein
MKSEYITLLLFLSLNIVAQQADSTVIKQVDSLINLSRSFTQKRDFERAIELNSTADKIVLENLGPESASYGSCCFNRGRISYFKDDYTEAEKWLLKAKSIRGQVLGKEHIDYAKTNNNLAVLYDDLNKFEEAEILHLETINIYAKINGREHPNYAQSLNNLAIVYMHMGYHSRAEEILLKALEIRGKVFGKESAEYAFNLITLGELYRGISNFEKSEHCYLESLAIRKKIVGKEHEDYAQGLTELGYLYFLLGIYKESEKYYLEAISIRKAIFGNQSNQYGASLQKLAQLYRDIGEYSKSDSLYLQAIAIKEKIVGVNHPDYGNYLFNYATLNTKMRRCDKALTLQLESNRIYEQIYGRDHKFVGLYFNQLGMIYMAKGDYNTAKKCFMDAMSFNEKANGSGHDSYNRNINNLAIACMYLGEYEKAQDLFTQSAKINRDQTKKSVNYLSEEELYNYLNKFIERNDMLLSLSQKTNQLLPEYENTCYDNCLYYKGFLLSSISQLKSRAQSSVASIEKYNQLKSYKIRLSREYSKPIVIRKNVTEWEAKSKELEKELARTVSGNELEMLQIFWNDVQLKLKHSEVAIEFINYQYYSPGKTDSTMYAALVLRKDSKTPIIINLFEQMQLISVLQSVRKDSIKRFCNNLYSFYDSNLYDLIWKRLQNELKGIERIYYSPSGLLHRLNLGAIPVNEKEVIADKYNLIEMGSTRNLVVGNYASDSSAYRKELSGNRDAVLFGGIEYDMDSTTLFAANTNSSNELFANRNSTRGTLDELKFNNTDSTNRGGNWYYLKWTEKEINSVEFVLKTKKIKTQIHKSYSATEEAFKQIGVNNTSPQILHIATHGYFFPDPKVGGRQSSVAGQDEPVFKLSDHPMIRSGLILAGGNHAWKTGKPFKEGMEDGILTAYEISQMNLSNTELVVLSACETGLGDIQGNEGVYGLQRAFKIAGAKYLIMSLWQVPDKQTSILMTTFYKKWLKEKMNIPDAFRAAQKELRNQGLDPYQWAGFVLVE